MVGALLNELRSRQRAAYLNSHTVRKGKQRVLGVDGEKVLPISEKQRAKVTSFVHACAAEPPNPAFYKVLDVGASHRRHR